MRSPAVTVRTAAATAALSSPRESTASCAPSARASSSAPGAMSTATTRAPAATATWIADRPTPPQPCTATHSPGRTLPWCTTARKAVP